MTQLSDKLQRATEKDWQRFEDKYMPEPNSGCWLWIGAIVPSKAGLFRGNFSFGGRPILAHRASYAMHFGSFDPSLHVCHSCDTPSCVNPDHLWLGTHGDNMADMVKKGRTRQARYPEQARQIGRRSGKMNTWMKGRNRYTIAKSKATA